MWHFGIVKVWDKVLEQYEYSLCEVYPESDDEDEDDRLGTMNTGPTTVWASTPSGVVRQLQNAIADLKEELRKDAVYSAEFETTEKE